MPVSDPHAPLRGSPPDRGLQNRSGGDARAEAGGTSESDALAPTLRGDPELARLVEAWPTLDLRIKQAIFRLVT
jgi:hypothetical protein